MSKLLKNIFICVLLSFVINSMYAITKVKVKGETDIRKKKPSIEEINSVF